MGIKLQRKKPRQFLLSVIYRMHRLLPMGSKAKLRLYLDLEWIFDRLAMEMSFRHYSHASHPFRVEARQFILDRITSEDRVLDLGCNQGDMSSYIADKAKLVVGVDHDADAIERARRSHGRPGLEFHAMDAMEYLGTGSVQFDVLILSHVLEHIDDPLGFLNSFKDHFRRIYIELPDLDRTYLNQYRQDLGSNLIYTDDDHVSEFDRYDLKDLLEEAGITIEQAEYRFGVQRLWCRVNKVVQGGVAANT